MDYEARHVPRTSLAEGPFETRNRSGNVIFRLFDRSGNKNVSVEVIGTGEFLLLYRAYSRGPQKNPNKMSDCCAARRER